MNREEILQKYRNENIDEGWEQVHKEGIACGYIAYVIVYFLMFLLNTHFRYDGAQTFFGTFFLIIYAVNNYSKYKFLKEKKYFRRMIFFAVWALLVLGLYFLGRNPQCNCHHRFNYGSCGNLFLFIYR